MRKALILCIIFLSTLGCFEARAQFDKSYFFWVGRNYLMESKYEAAIETLNALLNVDQELHEAYFFRGVAKYNLGDLLGAERDFTMAIQKNPVYTRAYNLRAITRTQIGNYDDALRDFQEAIDLRPDLPNSYYSRGVTYLLSQQYDKAIADLDKFIQQENRVVEAYIVRGAAYLGLRDTTRAYEEYNTAIRTNRYDPEGYFRRGLLATMQKDYGPALADLNKSIECDSTYIAGYFARAVLYSETDRPMPALADLDKVIGIDPSNMLAYFNRALVRSSIGDYNRAMDDYNVVAAHNPNNVLVYYNRAGLHAYLGNLQAAINDYTKAIELYPDFANAYLCRSELRALMRDEKGARSDRKFAEHKISEYRSKLSDNTFSVYADTSRNFKRLMAFDTKFARPQATDISSAMMPLFRFSLDAPKSHDKKYYSAEMKSFLAETGNPIICLTTHDSDMQPDSIIAMDRALERRIGTDNTDWLVLFERGITQSLIKQYTNSVNSYSAAIEKNPTNPFLYLNRSTTRSEMIDFISSIDNSYQRISVDSDLTNQLKTTTLRNYSYDEAISDLNKAAKLLPDFAYTYYNRGNLLALSGRMPEAYEDYTRAIALYPDFAEAYYNRALVQIHLKDMHKGLLDLSKAGELGIKQAYTMLKNYTQNE